MIERQGEHATTKNASINPSLRVSGDEGSKEEAVLLIILQGISPKKQTVCHDYDFYQHELLIMSILESFANFFRA